MNYEDEHYVRLYTRRTVTSRRLGWEGRAVMHEMMYEFDRAGVFDLDGDPYDAVELVTGLPQEVVRKGLERLLRLETWVVTGDGQLVWPNWLEGQTAQRSDKVRQRESRKRRRDTARRNSVTGCDTSERAVTDRDQESRGVVTESRGVTFGHEMSQPVTHSIAEQRDPPTPLPASPPRDRMLESLTGTAPGDRPDVRRLFDRFRKAVERPGLKFRGAHDLQAVLLAEAIDTHSLAECELVADEAPHDRMVTGDADDHGLDHRSVKYVFGNADAFARILAAAQKRQRKKPTETIENTMRRALAADADLTGYQAPAGGDQ